MSTRLYGDTSLLTVAHWDRWQRQQEIIAVFLSTSDCCNVSSPKSSPWTLVTKNWCQESTAAVTSGWKSKPWERNPWLKTPILVPLSPPASLHHLRGLHWYLAGKLSHAEWKPQVLWMIKSKVAFLSFPQKSETLPAWPTSPSDSRTVSSTPALPNSSLQTSSSTHPSTSCLNCENNACSQQLFFCCSYRTVLFILFFPLLHRFIFVAFSFPPMSLWRLGACVEALTEIQWTHSNTLQRALQTVTTVTSWVYILSCICVQVERQLLAILGWFS